MSHWDFSASPRIRVKDCLFVTALRGCPGWMRYGMYGLFGYAMINFLIFAQAAGKRQGSGPMPPDVVRGFSGHWYVRLTGGAVALR